ncbi:hypothetical protein BpHYR1_013046 [Brachionus plicatilis]|uniref:Uncharacterized protein n=1 Tax=Brachionus plicatilis TaxID=10195 RepID=A0A3M7RYI4_BRAPC|nr:hypothetical protein BpHYR1_013046 [Brachionus plicatilis]
MQVNSALSKYCTTNLVTNQTFFSQTPNHPATTIEHLRQQLTYAVEPRFSREETMSEDIPLVNGKALKHDSLCTCLSMNETNLMHTSTLSSYKSTSTDNLKKYSSHTMHCFFFRCHSLLLDLI